MKTNHIKFSEELMNMISQEIINPSELYKLELSEELEEIGRTYQ